MIENLPKSTATVTEVPLLLEIEPTYGCNLKCIMCHIPTYQNTRPVYLDIDALEKSTEGIENCHVIIGSEFEPTIHPQFEKLLRLVIKKKWKVDFLTNGVNLHKIDQGLLAEVPFHVFNASFDGCSKEVFMKSRVGANYDQVKSNIINTAALARKNGAATAINATVIQSNIHETNDLVEMWDDAGFDLIRLLIAQARSTSEDILNETLFTNKLLLFETLNDIPRLLTENGLRIGVCNGYYGSNQFDVPAGVHVYQGTIFSKESNYSYVPVIRQDFQLGGFSGMSVPCKSPFVYCRIRWDGVVDLCNRRKQEIGDIYNDSLADIWHGAQANNWREKILSDEVGCDACDYFRFCIGSLDQDYRKKEVYFSNRILKTQEVARYIEKEEAPDRR